MTPIINHILANAPAIAASWTTESGIPSLASFLHVLKDATVLHMPEAETDTTAAAELNPDHFCTNRHVRMTGVAMWLEYRSYSAGDTYAGDAATILNRLPDGDVGIYAVALIPPHAVVQSSAGIVITGPQPFLTGPRLMGVWRGSDLGDPDLGIGSACRVQPVAQISPEAFTKHIDFVRELLAFPTCKDVIAETVRPEMADQRRLRGVLGPTATFRPYQRLRLDGAAVSASSVAARASHNLGAASQAVN